VASLPLPAAHRWDAPYDLLVTGVGGTGGVTVGAVIAMAAHLEGKCASVLDFMGFAQKGGSVLSFVRLADMPERLHQVRIDTQQADALLACDIVVGASPEALQTVRHGRTRILANLHQIPVAESLRNPDASLQIEGLLAKLRHAAGEAQVLTFDAQSLAEEFLGDTVTSNILALGYAWQLGLVPISLQALTRAIELNGVAVPSNLAALSLGRIAAGDPAGLQALRAGALQPEREAETLAALIQRGKKLLTAWRDANWAARFEAQVLRVAQAERELPSADESLPLACAAARSLLKLMSYKDEYEVARLYTDGQFMRQLQAQFEGPVQLAFHMAPPLLARGRDGSAPRKMVFGGWMMTGLRVLARFKWLRGTALDPFGRTDERQMERELIGQFEVRLAELSAELTEQNRPLALQVAAIPLAMRGYGHVKLANVALARVREAELLNRFSPQRYPRPATPALAGQFRGIEIKTAAAQAAQVSGRE
jgi:indolepyruvate ferredoxin oxidoreductase